MKVSGSSYSNFCGFNLKNRADNKSATATDDVPNYKFYPSYIMNATWLPSSFGIKSYTKLENKTVDGIEYQQYKLSNGTTVLINPNPNAEMTSVSTSVKNALFKNGMFNTTTEAHLFEHMLGENSLINNGYFQRVLDGTSENDVQFITNCNDTNDIKNIINNQTKLIYNNDFSQEVFDIEKQTLNFELAFKTNGFGNRSDLENMDLNHLRQIRNQLIRPDNIEIIIDGNVNPEKIMYELSDTAANTPITKIKKLNNSDFNKIKVYEGDDIEKVQVKAKSKKSLNKNKTITALFLARTLALYSEKTDLASKSRTLAYGPYIAIRKNKHNGFNFIYENKTFGPNKDKLKNEYEKNFEKLKLNNFDNNDLENAKKILLCNLNLFYDLDEDLQELISKEDLIANVEKMSLRDVKRAIRRLHLEK